jgi:hypothetical protein
LAAPIDLAEGYSSQEERPLVAYLGQTGLYNALFVGALLLAKRTGCTLPERAWLSDLLLIGVATFEPSRIVTRDEVTGAMRAPSTAYQWPACDCGLMEEPHGHGLRKAIGEPLTRPFCIAQWIGTAFFVRLVLASRATCLIGSILSAVAISDFVQYARESGCKQAEG